MSLNQAISHLGGQTALAHAVKVKQQQVWNWINRSGGRVPAEHCPAIERATGGAVRCEDLRPDVEWAVLRICTHVNTITPAIPPTAAPIPVATQQEARNAA